VYEIVATNTGIQTVGQVQNQANAAATAIATQVTNGAAALDEMNKDHSLKNTGNLK